MHIEQGSAEWLQARVGKITASRVKEVVTRQKNGKPYKAYFDYQFELAMERLTGRAASGPNTWAMQRGTDLEPSAALEYEMMFGVTLEETGFWDHPDVPNSGASPDRLIKDVCGLVEIKCPLDRAFLEFFMREEAPEQYWWQCQWQMACTGIHCEFVDLFFFHPDMPEEMVGHRQTIERDDAAIAEAEEAIRLFDQEVTEIVQKCMKKAGIEE